MENASGVADVQRRTLDRLRDDPVFAGFYLVGGTAIACHLGHRRSLDLDLFSSTPDVVRYPYARLEPTLPGPAGFPLAGLLDLGAMKLAAIARRGVRRDFWDLHEIVTRGPQLAAVGAAYRLKFGTSENDLYQVARALTYFETAESELAWPRGLDAAHWSEVKRTFQREAPSLVRG